MPWKRLTRPDIVRADLLDPIKRHLRITWDDEDKAIHEAAEQAVEFIQEQTNQQYFTATFVQKLDRFPALTDCWYIPPAPFQSLQSITYLDGNGAQQTWATTEYEVVTENQPAQIRLKYQKTLPSPARSIEVNYTAGYGLEYKDLPPNAQQLLQLVTAHFHLNRDGGAMGDTINRLLHQLTVGDEFVAA